MRILHIIRSVNPEGGGPIEGIKQLSRYSIINGYFIEILCLDAPDAAYVKDCPLKVYSLGPGLRSYGYSKNLIPWLFANHQNYDAFVINGIWQFHSYAAHYALKKLRRDYYIFTHGMLDPWFKREYPIKHIKKWLYWIFFEYSVLNNAKRVLFTCEEEKIVSRESFKKYQCQETVVNYGTSGHAGLENEQRDLFLNTYTQLKNKRYLLFLSRIHPKKGLDLLIKAFAKITQHDNNLELVIAGPDQIGWKKELNELAEKLGISNKITWTGMLKNDLKWGAYLNAEAFILPSHQENFGIVVAEALSCSLPVLISNKVNIWHEIQNDGAGLVCNDDEDGITGLLYQWVNLSIPDKESMKLNARECFLNRFEITRASAKLLSLYSNDKAQINNKY